MQGHADDVSQIIKQAISAHKAGRFDQAEKNYKSVLKKDPDHFDALHLLGVIKAQRGFLKEADILFTRARAINSEVAALFMNHCRLLIGSHRFEEGLECADKALELEPENGAALVFRGNALSGLRRFKGAIESYDRALELEPGNLEALNNLANSYLALGHNEKVVAVLYKVLKNQPENESALRNLGISLHKLKRNEEAVIAFEKLLRLNPNFPFAKGALLFFKMNAGDWRGIGRLQKEIIEELRAGKQVVTPFQLATLSGSAGDQKRCAELWVESHCPAFPHSSWRSEPYEHDRIRVGYLSADFHDHATSYLMAELFERHNKKKFNVTGLSIGTDQSGDMRRRLTPAFDRFFQLTEKSDREVADLIRDLRIDILVDLKGFTSNSRPGILARHPAPIQVNYLGFPGTMGAEYIEYILADEVVIPRTEVQHFSEAVVYMPDCYQVNDSKRAIAAEPLTPQEAGLPEEGFVFCCFNNGYKITPAIFDIWMRLLRQVEGSVLWLLQSDTSMAERLKGEAKKRGVSPERLVFAPKVKLEHHLARHRLAGLFLDTLPCNAHTTASDALWAGLPVVTCLGDSFAGRVAASLLNAVGLPDMVTHSLEDYEALALRLARDGAALAEVKERLRKKRDSEPLFDSSRFRDHIEAAYREMWQRLRDGRPAESFTVERIASNSK